jgi:signal transduction histidine kinase
MPLYRVKNLDGKSSLQKERVMRASTALKGLMLTHRPEIATLKVRLNDYHEAELVDTLVVAKCGIKGVSWVPKWLLPTLSELLMLSDSSCDRGSAMVPSEASMVNDGRGSSQVALRQIRAEREWYGAIAALQVLLQHCLTQADDSTAPTIHLNGEEAYSGFVLSGPSAVLSQPKVAAQFASRTMAAASLHSPHWFPFQLLPGQQCSPYAEQTPPTLSLLPGDPLASEPFCLVLTPWFSLVMVLGETLSGDPAFLFSFAPEVVQRSWEAIRPRILLMNSQQVDYLDELVQQFPPVIPDYKTVMQFSRLMLEHLPELEDLGHLLADSAGLQSTQASVKSNQSKSTAKSASQAANRHTASPVQTVPAVHTLEDSVSEVDSPDVELLHAIAHEVRTPLTTIRTLTRSLLKRTDLPPDVVKRLGIIDRECSEQINRFGLIFRAVELETAPTQKAPMSLTRTFLADIFQQSIPRWQQQASHHQMTLDFVLPQKMPAVVSDPTLLDQVFTSLIERFTRNLPPGSHIQVEVTLAGSQLKLQVQSYPDASCESLEKEGCGMPKSAKSIGQLLMFQPETGSLSLNLSVTKNLFQAIGGKLTVKQRPKQGEVMTVYFPLEMTNLGPLDNAKIITV